MKRTPLKRGGPKDGPPTQERDQARADATKWLNVEGNSLGLRSCWNCNAAHGHLKQADYVFNCFSCGHYFYRGVDLTEDEAPE